MSDNPIEEPESEPALKWERIPVGKGYITRLEVPGGWLYSDPDAEGHQPTYVPNPDAWTAQLLYGLTKFVSAVVDKINEQKPEDVGKS